jgi:hypothetical protein
MRLDLGRAQQISSDSGSRFVRLIILERLPPTLLLMTTASFRYSLSVSFLRYSYPGIMAVFLINW